MTRAECETKILEKMKEIWNIYREYNPEGNYFTAYVINHPHPSEELFISFNNSHYEEDNIDAERPLNYDSYREDNEDE